MGKGGIIIQTGLLCPEICCMRNNGEYGEASEINSIFALWKSCSNQLLLLLL